MPVAVRLYLMPFLFYGKTALMLLLKLTFSVKQSCDFRVSINENTGLLLAAPLNNAEVYDFSFVFF